MSGVVMDIQGQVLRRYGCAAVVEQLERDRKLFQCMCSDGTSALGLRIGMMD